MIEICQKHRLTDRALKAILNLFKDTLPAGAKLPTFNELTAEKPMNSQCLLHHVTPTEEFVILDLGEQVKEIVQRNFHRLSITNSVTIKLLFYSDGGTLFKSPLVSIWPILLSIMNLPPDIATLYNNICVGALWKGRGKPCWDEYMGRFIDYFHMIVTHPIIIFVDNVEVSITCVVDKFIADMPAKCSILNMMQFNGRYGCTNCLAEGVHRNNRRLYLPGPTQLRTNASYTQDVTTSERDGAPSHGVKGKCMMSKVISIPSDVAIDYMHQVCLGVTRTLFFIWSTNNLLDSATLELLSELHSAFVFPHDVKRKPRSFKEAKQWKAIEWKHFLLFTGPVILQHNLDSEYFSHFLLLSTAIFYLCDSSTSPVNTDFAGRLLKLFHDSLHDLYEEEIYSFNMHSLSHLADQTQHFGSLTHVSAFPFESVIGKLVKLVRTPQSPLQQIVNGFLNRKLTNCHTSLASKGVGLSSKLTNSLIDVCMENDVVPTLAYKRAFVGGKVYRARDYPYVTLKTCSAVVVLQNGICGQIIDFVESDKSELFVYINVFENQVRVLPASVTLGNIIPMNQLVPHVKCYLPKSDHRLVTADSIKSKCALLHIPNKPWFYCIELLHSFEHD